jgi:hypothetical protein
VTERYPGFPPDALESIMAVFQALFYLIAIVLLVAAALPLPSRRSGGVGLALLGAAFALTAFAAPTFDAAF